MKYEILSGWESDILAKMREVTAYVPGGGAALNTRVVSNLHSRYLVLVNGGMSLPRYETEAGDFAARAMMLKLSADTGISTPIVLAFLKNLYRLVKAGKIPENKYDPVGAAARAEIKRKLSPSALDRVTGAATSAASFGGKIGIGLLAVAALGAAIYFRLGRK